MLGAFSRMLTEPEACALGLWGLPRCAAAMSLSWRCAEMSARSSIPEDPYVYHLGGWICKAAGCVQFNGSKANSFCFPGRGQGGWEYGVGKMLSGVQMFFPGIPLRRDAWHAKRDL